ncbi:hypothetical protein [Streptomyces sp. HUAS TT7]|uniref:hypothetical protein n=1 Tax=Streptomyces sp. HUAS TT7 TaxID=3447507 RepID=UPI003F66011E
MQRGLIRGSVWLAATVAAVATSWWGVRGVMSLTQDSPKALLVTEDRAASAPASPAANPSPPAGRSPSPHPSGTPSSPTGHSSAVSSSNGPTSPPSRPGSNGATHSTGTGASTPSRHGNVTTVSVAGGSVDLDMGESSASVVSATPASGWVKEVSKQQWLVRVDFTNTTTGRTSWVICSWYEHPPLVEKS